MPLKHTVTEVALKNGAKGLIIDVPGTTVVRYDIGFRAGNNYVLKSDISQVAHILEHLAFQANEKYPSQEAFSQEFTKNGAYNNAWTGSVDIVYTSSAALMEWERILDLERLSITKPKYSSDVLEREKGNVREELVGYATNNFRVLWQKISRAAGLHDWYDPDELLTVDKVTLDDVGEHFKRTHTLSNMRFIVAGDFTKQHQNIVDSFEGYELPTGERFAIPARKASGESFVHIRRNDVPNLTFDLRFFLNRDLTRQELRVMATLNHILTGSFHSRILGEARSRGICYGMWSSVSASPANVSDWEFRASVSFDNATELFDLIAEQLRIISDHGITDTELEQAKEYRLGALQMDAQTVSSLVAWYEDTYFDYGNIDHVDKMEGLIKAVTIAEVQALAGEFLSSGIWAFGGIGNIDKPTLKKHYDQFAELVHKEVK